MTDELHTAIRQVLQTADRPAVIAHIRPDGDAIGALLGLGLALQAAGKRVQLILADGVPRSFRHLPGSSQVRKSIEGEIDAAIVLDCSDMLRTGGVLGERQPDVNIDHHVTNLHFARLNLVAPEFPATSAILAEYLPSWGFPITTEVAQPLLSGIIADTIGFRTANTTPHTLRLAAALMETGCDMADLYNRALVRRSFAAARYWGIALERLQNQNGIVWTYLTMEDRARAGYSGNDDADLINVLSAIEEGEIAIIFIEQKSGKIKVSWRSVPGVDVSPIALKFGGGGHPNASGAEVDGPLAAARERVLAETILILNNPSGHNHVMINPAQKNLSSTDGP